MLREIFREYDIRGIAQDFSSIGNAKIDLSEPVVKMIGFELAREMMRRGVGTLSIGYDARLSAGDLFKWLVSGINAANADSAVATSAATAQNAASDAANAPASVIARSGEATTRQSTSEHDDNRVSRVGLTSADVAKNTASPTSAAAKTAAVSDSAKKIEIFNIGMAPTPVGYFSVFSQRFDANIMITGSHNPKEYNGFKITIFKESFFGKDLQDLAAKVEAGLGQGVIIKDDFRAQNYDILPDYIAFFKEQFAHLNGFKIPLAIDCANGTAAITMTPILKALNIKADILYPQPDGNFPNHHPDPSEEQNLADLKARLKEGAALAFGFDGDCDRLAVLTKNRIIKGDELAYLYALKMEHPRVLGEVKCSQNMFDEIGKFGTAIMGKTGHSNIKKAMRELDIDLAAEVSGHIFFKERFFGFDDAVYAAFRVIELVAGGADLDAELDKLPKLFSTDELKIPTTDSAKFAIINELKEILAGGADGKMADGDLAGLPPIENIIDIDGVRIKFAGGWALARASNTTPVIVTRFEATSQKSLETIQSAVQDLLSKIKAKYA